MLSLLDWEANHSQLIRKEFEKVLFYFVDGTVVEVEEPYNVALRRQLWNNKHHFHAFSFFILVAPSGRIVYVSKLEDGNKHDKTAWEESTAVSELTRFYGAVESEFQLAIGGDKAYPNMTVPKGWHKYITKSGEQEAHKMQDNLHLTPEIAKHRAVVERTIGKIKDWHVLTKHEYISKSIDRAEKLVFILCNLVNLEHFPANPATAETQESVTSGASL